MSGPFEERGWESRTISIEVLGEKPDETCAMLDPKYLEKIFKNCGLKAVKMVFEGKPGTLAYMNFTSKKDAEAVLSMFDGTCLPGYTNNYVNLRWVSHHQLNVLKKPGKGYKRTCGDSLCSSRTLKKRKSNSVSVETLLPFSVFMEEEKVKCTETYRFRAACIVASVKPTDPRCSEFMISDDGSDILFRIFKHVTDEHKQGRSWGGAFDLDDILMSVSDFRIKPTAKLSFSSINGNADCKEVLVLLAPFYTVDGQLPLFFKQLEFYVDNHIPHELEKNRDLNEEYILCIVGSAALAKSYQRRHLLQDFYIFYDGLSKEGKAKFEKDFPSTCPDDWRSFTNKDTLLRLIYTEDGRYGPYPAKRDKDRFSRSVIHQAAFLRHLLVHSPQRSMVLQRQIFETLKELEMFIIHYYPKFYEDFINALSKAAKDYPLLSSVITDYIQR